MAAAVINQAHRRGRIRDYEALRWWVIPPLLFVLVLANGVAMAFFKLAWFALPSVPDLSSIYYYIFPGAWETYQNYAACSREDIGSFYAGLQVFNLTVVVAMDLAVMRVIALAIPIYKTKNFSGTKVHRRTFGAAFWSFLILGALFLIDIDPRGCEWIADPDLGKAIGLTPAAAILALVASPALRNTY